MKAQGNSLWEEKDVQDRLNGSTTNLCMIILPWQSLECMTDETKKILMGQGQNIQKKKLIVKELFVVHHKRMDIQWNEKA